VSALEASIVIGTLLKAFNILHLQKIAGLAIVEIGIGAPVALETVCSIRLPVSTVVLFWFGI
jgi:hypothetical protein